jgi:hypothetical protein
MLNILNISHSIFEPFDCIVIKAQSLNDTVSFIDIVTCEHIRFRNLNQTLTFTDTASENHVNARSISESLTLTDLLTFEHSDFRYVQQSLILSDSLTFTHVNVRNLSQTLTFTDIVSENHINVSSILDTVSFIDTATYQHIRFRSVSDELTFVESLSPKYTLGLISHDILILNQATYYSSNGIFYVNLSNELAFIDNTTYQHIRYLNLTDELIFEEILVKSKIVDEFCFDILNFSTSLYHAKYIVRSLSDHLIFGSSLSKSLVTFETLISNLNLNQSLHYILAIPISLSDELIFNDNAIVNINNIITISVSDVISFVETSVKTKILDLFSFDILNLNTSLSFRHLQPMNVRCFTPLVFSEHLSYSHISGGIDHSLIEVTDNIIFVDSASYQWMPRRYRIPVKDTNLRRIRSLLYQLKRAYGRKAYINRRGIEILNYETGQKSALSSSLFIKRAILMPGFATRNFMPGIPFAIQGGVYDIKSRPLIIDRKDLKDTEFDVINLTDYFVIHGSRYDIKDIENLDYKLGYYIVVQEQKGAPPDKVMAPRFEDTLVFTETMGTQ